MIEIDRVAEESQSLLAQQEQLRQTADKLKEQGIVSLAVLGPAGSPDASLPRGLGVESVRLFETYEEVVQAAGETDVGAILPVIQSDGVTIIKANYALRRRADRASIASFIHPTTQQTVKVLVAHS